MVPPTEEDVVDESHGFEQRSKILFEDVGCRVGFDVHESSASGFVYLPEASDPLGIRGNSVR